MTSDEELKQLDITELTVDQFIQLAARKAFLDPDLTELITDDIDAFKYVEQASKDTARRRAKVRRGRGILGKDWLDGEDPTDYVRRLRDGTQ